jgi:hypothetical protein
LKDRRVLRAVRALAAVALILAILLGIASLPWRGDRAAEPPRPGDAPSASGRLSAGFAVVPFELPAGVPLGGFARVRWASEGVRDPVGARAVVLAAGGLKVALVAAELVLVPEELEAAVRERVADVGLGGLVVAATHTHAGPGGFWHNPVGERAGTGPYDRAVRDLVADAMARAVREAAASAVPVRATAGAERAETLVRSRSGGEKDGRLTVVRLEPLEGGAPVAELVVFPAHPTMLGKRNRLVSGDWPSRLLALGERGPRLFLQGAVGDQSTTGHATPEAYGEAVSRRVDGIVTSTSTSTSTSTATATSTSTATAAGATLAFAEAEVVLPSVAPGALPGWLRPAARTVAGGLMPATARVAAIRVGSTVLLAVPGEPVAAVAAGWRERLGGDLAAELVILGLAGGYVGYVEAPDRMERRQGETVRTYYGPELAERLEAGLAAVLWSVRPGASRPRSAAPRSPRRAPGRGAGRRAPRAAARAAACGDPSSRPAA